MEPKIYGIIVEFKTEQPFIMEGYPMNYDAAKERMRCFENDRRVIRVAVFEMKCVGGHKTLIERENKNEQ